MLIIWGEKEPRSTHAQLSHKIDCRPNTQGNASTPLSAYRVVDDELYVLQHSVAALHVGFLHKCGALGTYGLSW